MEQTSREAVRKFKADKSAEASDNEDSGSDAAMSDDDDDDADESSARKSATKSPTVLDFQTLVSEFEGMVPDTLIGRFRICVPEDPAALLRHYRRRYTSGNERGE